MQNKTATHAFFLTAGIAAILLVVATASSYNPTTAEDVTFEEVKAGRSVYFAALVEEAPAQPAAQSKQASARASKSAMAETSGTMTQQELGAYRMRLFQDITALDMVGRYRKARNLSPEDTLPPEIADLYSQYEAGTLHPMDFAEQIKILLNPPEEE